MLYCAEYYILLCSKTAISYVWVYHSTLQVKIPESKFNNLCSKLGIHDNHPLLEELYGINALSSFDLDMMAFVCQYNKCSIICVSGGAMCKYYKTLYIKEESVYLQNGQLCLPKDSIIIIIGGTFKLIHCLLN